ncbi:hypothetical protein GCM10023194_40760 [Planotetraspora phitsanulokensis]|uniref:Uncharacterized protein n=1 Tax=Planotetraspora phitsanulokensis TaxID=575192 RepID=A0A8J3UCR8_9ACTN|nr:hypothetical protein [Planotetraspora phitsanulokensis]GII40936.1 hypothetical protein Pph01_59390 [Planotetraspora phitsanulokensis]
MSSEIDWWPNLLQGALSAVVGGVVAAVTAWAVVSITGRQVRRQAAHDRAIAAAQALIQESQFLIAAVEMVEPWRRWTSRERQYQRLRVAGTRFSTRAMLYKSIITAVDPDFGRRLDELLDPLHSVRPMYGEGAKRWSTEDGMRLIQAGDLFIFQTRGWIEDESRMKRRDKRVAAA